VVRRGIGIVAWAALAVAVVAAAQPHDHEHPGEEAQKARADSLGRAAIWGEVVQFTDAKVRVTDVAFAASGRNILTAVQMVWLLADSLPELVAMAARPMAGTAEPGEELGRRGADILRRPVALHTNTKGSWVVERDGRIAVLQSNALDTLQLRLAGRAARDLAVGTTGLLYVLTDRDVRVWPRAETAAPLWTIPLPPALLPAVALDVSARGDVYVVGTGKTALAVFALGASGAYRLARSVTAAQADVGAPGGVTLLEQMLLPLPGREGWVSEDRYVAMTDAKSGTLVVLDVPTLRVVGRSALAADAPGILAGRVDINNRGQVAVVDRSRGAAWVLPTRVLAAALAEAPLRWRRIVRDSLMAPSTTRP
jgi:hypothetical protein